MDRGNKVAYVGIGIGVFYGAFLAQTPDEMISHTALMVDFLSFREWAVRVPEYADYVFGPIVGMVAFSSLVWILLPAKKPEYNSYLPARTAIDYIAWESSWGVAEGKDKPAFEMPLRAIAEFNKRAIEGTIVARGKRKFTGEHVNIDPWAWRSIELDGISIVNPDPKTVAKTEARDVFSDNDANYDDVLLATVSLEALWPKATRIERLKNPTVRKYLEWKAKREQKTRPRSA